MSYNIGKAIGKVRHTFSTKNSRDEVVQTTITFDFSTASDTDIKRWLTSNRVIAFQRPIRGLSRAEIEELDGTTIIAKDAGKKVKSREERIEEFTAVGIPRPLAEMAVDDPAKFEAIMSKINDNTED